MKMNLAHYAELLSSIKDRVRLAQTKAMSSANRQMLELYWDIGRLMHVRQEAEGWGAGVLRKLAGDLKSELSGVRGFSERNLKRMSQFYRAYPSLISIRPPAVAQLTDRELTRALPEELESSLPTIEDIEAELSGAEGTDDPEETP